MRIAYRPSGGRGEYEVAYRAPSGLQPGQLVGRFLRLRLGTLVLDTGLQLLLQGGKRRLRSPFDHPQVQLQAAFALLLPEPTRQEGALPSTRPVLQTDRYRVSSVELEAVDLVGDNAFEAAAAALVYGNQHYTAEEMPIADRIRQVRRIWGERFKLPMPLERLVREHEQIVGAGTPIREEVLAVVRTLQNQLEIFGDDLGVGYYSQSDDVVPVLLDLLNSTADDEPEPLDQLDPERPELRRREAERWLQWARRRGPASRRFRREVCEAYDYRCVMCGERFPATHVNRNPGVDAAHILPWAKYVLDEVYNGLALCKLHHWAFDERLLRLVPNGAGGGYSVELSAAAEQELAGTSFSVSRLREAAGPVPRERLPADQRQWPRPDLLVEFYAELG